MTDRRFIEESFPVKEVGEISAKEKSIRHGHISTLHIWWARRPLAASRATAYAALTPAPTSIEEWQKKRDFIIELSKWENSNNPQLLERARQDILDANGGVPPKVLDPFAGGGSYPLEALRLGCEAYASDYNPVAVLIEKATLEYPQKFGRPFEGMPEWALPGATEKRFGKGKRSSEDDEETGETAAGQPSLFNSAEKNEDAMKNHNPLLEGVRYWGKWVLEEARKELAEFYPPDPDGSIPVGYIWARTIPCQNPVCRAEIPLIRQFWLAKKDKKKVSLYPDTSNGKLEFRIVGDGYASWPEGFDPENGTVARAVATCLVCGGAVDGNTTHHLFRDGQAVERMLVVVMNPPSRGGKVYRIAIEADKTTYQMAAQALHEKREKLILKWGLNPVPDEALPPKESHRAVGSQLPVYGYKSWSDLFNARQQLTLITFADKVHYTYTAILEAAYNDEFAKAVVTYLALGLDMTAAFTNNLARWENTSEAIKQLYSRQALPMVWDYAEVNPFSGASGSFETGQKYYAKVMEHCSMTDDAFATVTQSSATHLLYPDDFFDAVLTDPPYYDNVPYSYLSDFFYVWLKRSVGHLYPDLFSTPLTPKAQEIVAYSLRDGGFAASQRFFEENLKRAFQEIQRVLKPQGVVVLVYAHKSTEGWEAVINALLDSGLVVASAWPINTEMQSRLNADETAALASSIYIVARKKSRQSTGFYNDVRQELRKHLDAKLHRLWEEGIGGADFFIAAIGSAIEVFGKYGQVMDLDGNIVRADRLLEEVRTIATDYAVRQILHNGFATEISDLSRLYVLWRWNYGEALVPFDEGRKLAQSCGIDLSQQWGKNGFIKKEKEFIRLLGPQNRKLDDLDDPRDMIDVLHKTLLFWEQSKRSEMIQTLSERSYGKSEAFYRVAQAISETLPNESKEKKLLDGFLAGRERVQQEVEKVGAQGRLWE